MSELWDCYDSNFNKVPGKVLARGDSSRFGEDEYHLVSEVVVRHTDGTYLIMQRDLRKESYPGYWELTAGGSALQGETPLECVVRELQEETGLRSDTIVEVGRKTVDRNHCHYVEYFATVSCDKDSVTLQEGETIAYRWVEIDEIFAMREKLATKRVFDMFPDFREMR